MLPNNNQLNIGATAAAAACTTTRNGLDFLKGMQMHQQ